MQKNTVNALKDLYVKLGGELTTVSNDSTIPDCIDAITEVVELPSGKDLVATSDDNGTVTISVR